LSKKTKSGRIFGRYDTVRRCGHGILGVEQGRKGRKRTMAKVKEAVKKPIEQKVRTNRILAVDSLIRAGKYPNATTIAKRFNALKWREP
jgi:hypothetical protein